MKLIRMMVFGFVFVGLTGGLDIVAASGAAAEDNGKIVAVEDYVFPSYDDAVEKTDAEKYASVSEYDRAVEDKRFRFQKLTYLSDGLKVKAYLYKLRKIKGKTYPAVVFNRGSYVRGDIAPELITMFHRLANSGFVVVAPMYRQSDGGEGRDRLGGDDMNDLMNVVPLIKSLSFIDPENLFLYGESRGGMMTYQAMKNGFPANAASVFGAFTDMKAMVEAQPKVYSPQVAKAIFGEEYDTRKEKIFEARSAIRWYENFKIPVLILHGSNDQSVHPRQSILFALKLLEAKKPYELLIYKGDNHILSENRIDRDRRTARWFTRHMKR